MFEHKWGILSVLTASFGLYMHYFVRPIHLMTFPFNFIVFSCGVLSIMMTVAYLAMILTLIKKWFQKEDK